MQTIQYSYSGVQYLYKPTPLSILGFNPRRVSAPRSFIHNFVKSYRGSYAAYTRIIAGRYI
jgi:hypothetical protein